MKPAILDRYLSRRMLTAYVQVAVALVLLVIVIDLLATRRRVIDKYDVPWGMVLQYYLAFAPTIFFKYQAAALSMLVAGLVVFGRAAQDNEVTAVLASGVSLRRFIRFPALLAALLAVGVFLLGDTVGAAAFARYHRIDQEYFRRFSEDARAGVSWTNLSGNWTAHVRKFNRAALTGEGVIIHQMDADRVQDIQARRILWDPEQERWLLEDGRWFVFDTALNEERTTRITQMAAPFTEPPRRLFALDEPPDAKPAAQLRRDLAEAGGLGMPVQAQWVDYHLKFSQPALVFVMLLLAVPFALRVRRGGLAIGFGVAITIGLAYVLVFFVSSGLGHLQKLPPLAAAWGPNVLFLGLGLYLLRRSPT